MLAVTLAMFSATAFLIYSQLTNQAEVTGGLAQPLSQNQAGQPAGAGAIQVNGLVRLNLESQEELNLILSWLEKFGDWPVMLRELGKSNPFVPTAPAGQ